jgi:hypothetical protein
MGGSEGPRQPAFKLGWYAVPGILALVIPLVGLLGGHRLVASAFGADEDGEAIVAPTIADPACPVDRYAADACDDDELQNVTDEAALSC